MREYNWKRFSWEVLALLFIFVGGVVVGCLLGFKDLRTKAVQHHAAEWTVHDDGTTEFKWKDEP